MTRPGLNHMSKFNSVLHISRSTEHLDLHEIIAGLALHIKYEVKEIVQRYEDKYIYICKIFCWLLDVGQVYLEPLIRLEEER
jgi:hypothetical protein